MSQRLRLLWLASGFAMALLGACNVSIPNGLFACGQPSDCPTGFFCWNIDSRCYDAKEPGCPPKACETIIAEFAAVGIEVECGALPDGCDSTVECGGCPDGDACGANGENFVCGCEENTCANFAGGAECGVVPTRCGGEEQAINCGSCLGDFVCQDNKCICPPGETCDNGCNGGEPTYPCSSNDCSPPEGLPDGCGGVAHCPPCDVDEECLPSDNLRFECLGNCTCEAQGVECGNATICDSPRACGSCADNGLDGYRCDDGKCICEDQYEENESPNSGAVLCDGASGLSCLQPAWSVDIQATLHGGWDDDYYQIEALDSDTLITAQAYGGLSLRRVFLSYICPDGSSGISACSGSMTREQGTDLCVAEGDFVTIQRSCGGAGVGTVIAGVQARDFYGECDVYGLTVLATYEPVAP